MSPRPLLVGLLALVASCKGDSGLQVYTSPPVVTLITPNTDEEFEEGELITFEARVGDDQDAPGDLELTWISDLDGTLSESGRADGSGAVVFNTENLSPGAHVVTLVVTDSDGQTSEDFVTISVIDLPDAPSVQILSPTIGETGVEDELFRFAAFVDDSQDPSTDLLVTMTSDVDGEFCAPPPDATGRAECEAVLSPGDHILTFEAIDTEGFALAVTQAFTVVAATDIDDDEDGYTERMGDCDDADPSTYPSATEVPNETDDDCDGEVDEDTVLSDDDDDGYTEIEGDCDDAEATVFPSGVEVCDAKDNDCDTRIDEGTNCVDDDSDGWTELAGDCDDADPKRYPGLTETCDSKDNDCDGTVDDGTECYDDDGDGMTELDGDCDDADVARYTGFTETCDSKDNDCDGTVDETTACYDDDGDGYTENGGDCDDAEDAAYPSATELPDLIDNDCDGTVDEGTILYDDDGDGLSESDGDCDDANRIRFPGNSEECDAVDNDCDGTVDEGTRCYDDDSDGYTEDDGDCDDAVATVYPAAPELADTLDNDCDGIADEGTSAYDDDGDCRCETAPCTGSIEPTCASLLDGDDCDDDDENVNPDMSEVCNTIDDDCDGATDESSAVDAGTWYVDSDGDGYGTGAGVKSCSKPTGYAASSGDCSDTKSAINPGATETCNSTDDDCDGSTDEGVTTTYYRDADGDGYGTSSSTRAACSKPTGYTVDSTDCNDADATINPATVWYIDADGDAYGTTTYTLTQCATPTGYVRNKTDCNDLKSDANPAATEKCDSYDNDCDAAVDEESATGCSTYYLDNDADAYGSTTSKCLCTATGKYTVTNKSDCYDSNASAKPGVTSWFTAHRGDGSSDYNCDSNQEKRFTSTFSCSFYCASWTAGWTSSTPSCASSASYTPSCDWTVFGGCYGSGAYSGAQECR
jgi:hypothetical protein